MTHAPSSFQTHLAAFATPRIAPIGVRTGAPAAAGGSAPTLAPHTWNALVAETRPAPRPVPADRGMPALRPSGAEPVVALPAVTVSCSFRTGLEAIAVAFACHVRPLIAMVERMRWAEDVLVGGAAGAGAARRQTAEGLLAIDQALAASAIEAITRLFRVDGPVLERDATGRSRLGAFVLVYRGALFDARLAHRDGALSAQVIDTASGFCRDIDPAETAHAWFGPEAGETAEAGGPGPARGRPAAGP